MRAKTTTAALLLAGLAAASAGAEPRTRGAIDMIAAGEIRPEAIDVKRAAPPAGAVRRALDTGQAAFGVLAGPLDRRRAEVLERWRFRSMTLADARVMSRGAKGLETTLKAFRDAGIEVAGAGPDAEEAARPLVNRYAGRQVGLLALNLSAGGAGAGRGPGVAFVDADAFREAIARARRDCELLIVVASGAGGGGSPAPTEPERSAARAAVEAGADAVILQDGGAVRAVERVGDALVLYGLGALVSGSPSEGDGVIARLSFGAEGSSAALFPIDAGGGAPKPASPAQAARIRGALDALGALSKEPERLVFSTRGNRL